MDTKYLFNTDRFLAYQGNPLVVEEEMGASSARLALFVAGEQGFSPLKAPFGSVEMAGPYSEPLVLCMLARLDKEAASHHLRSISITMPPDGYQPELSQKITDALLGNGFQYKYQDLNFHLDTQTDFRKTLHRSERWKLNKMLRSGFHFEKTQNPDWDKAYSLLEISRIRKKYSLSMTKDTLRNTFDAFPENYHMFQVWRNSEVVALAIAVRVSEAILYVFYTADELATRKYSPVVLLHDGLVAWCRQHNIVQLDLGTASLQGKVNDGVATFKRNLGGIASTKNTLIKNYQATNLYL